MVKFNIRHELIDYSLIIPFLKDWLFAIIQDVCTLYCICFVQVKWYQICVQSVVNSNLPNSVSDRMGTKHDCCNEKRTIVRNYVLNRMTVSRSQSYGRIPFVMFFMKMFVEEWCVKHSTKKYKVTKNWIITISW